ncbi:MAG: DUF4159 domain-containing protein [Blastocatellia bacterium]|nr:DUF4159 domain-containing protein [Blastocatellia bacterium]
MRKLIFIIVLIFLTVAPATFSAAPNNGKYRYNDPRLGEREDVSNKFTFVRIMFGEFHTGWPLGDGPIGWSHDYPEAGLHFTKILSEVSKIPINLDMNEYIFRFDDPDLFKYPLAYLCEVGDMDLTDEEVAGMREYLLRGGFLLVDDFRGSWSMQNFADYVRRAIPEYEIKELDVSHPIFNCFFSIKSLDDARSYARYKPTFFGVEDKNGRLMMIINYNNDVSDYWQWSNDPFSPIEDTNTAYKFGVNYVFYALTH